MGMPGTEGSAGMLREKGSHRDRPGGPECRQSLMTQSITSPRVLVPRHPGIIIDNNKSLPHARSCAKPFM